MSQKLTPILLLSMSYIALAQNVGIGTALPSERLHVNGNLRFDGALMPAGDAGISGQVLVSQGPSTPPIWGSPVEVHSGYTSATVELPSNGALTTVITLPVLTLREGQKVILMASGHGRNWPSDCFATAELRIRVNGNPLPQGGATRFMTDYRTTSPTQETWLHAWGIVATYDVPANGNYTFSLTGQRLSPSGSGCGMYVGGNDSPQPRASLIAIVVP